MRTLLLAEAPLRDLTSRAVLAEALAAIKHTPPAWLATRAQQVPPGFAASPPGQVPEGTEQVVLVGPFLDRAWLEGALATAAAALAMGARLVVHNLGLEGSAALAAAPAGAQVLEAAGQIGVRDHRTANALTLWRLAAPKVIQAYPERHLPPDPALAGGLPEGPILGLAIRGGEEMRRSWQPRLPALSRCLAAVGAGDWPVLVLPTRLPGVEDDDVPASLAIADAVLPGTPRLLPELAEQRIWRRRMNGATLKGLVARCRLVVTNRDLVAACAVGAGVPVLGLALGADRRIISCLATLANELPPGSALLHLPPGP